ncbi:MAG: mucoidy inhibitor MuiA family protein [Bacteroidota bacterium]
MKQIYILFLGLIFVPALAQESSKIDLETKIEQVKVFLKSAEITRTGTANLAKGDVILTINELSPYIDKKSIQVKGDGEFKIMSVNHQYDFLNEKKKSQQVSKIIASIKAIKIEIKRTDAKINLLNEKIDFLNNNKRLSPEKLANVSDLESVLRFYEKELDITQQNKIETELKKDELEDEVSALEKELLQVAGKEEKSSSEILIKVRTTEAEKADFTVSYVVKNAGWFPKYDIRAKDVNSPIEIDYKASLYQNTGEDWDNVKLIFSNIDVTETGLAPKLNTWKLNFDRYTTRSDILNNIYGERTGNVRGMVVSGDDGLPIPGVNVVVKGTTVGAVTDIDGNYSITLPNGGEELVFSFIGMETQEVAIGSRSLIDVSLNSDVQQLSEVVVTAMGISREKRALGYSVSSIDVGNQLSGRVAGVSVRGSSSINSSNRTKNMMRGTMVNNQTSVDFVIDEKYTLKSNGKALLIDLKQYVVDGIFEYYAVPKLNSAAFLMAKIVDWNKFGFLEGEANLYFEEAFVGKSILETKTSEDTLRISLGKDRNVLVQREKIEEFSKRRSVGSNKIEKTGIKLIIKNNKQQAISLNLYDQIPVSVNNAITVNITENESGILDEREGIIEWVLTIEPNKTEEVDFTYEVKYPKYEKVSLE